MPALPTRVSNELVVIKQLHEHTVGGDMKASPQDQRSILDIQGFDFATSTLTNKIKNLPETLELSATIIKSTNARDLRIAAQTELSDVKRELLRAEADVEQIVTRITRDEARLSGGSASPKELEQLQHEVVSLNARRSELEEVELEIMMRVEAINTRISDLENEEKTLAAEIEDLEIRKENALAALNNEIESIAKERSETLASVDKTFADLYEKIRSSNGTGAASLVGGQCKGCNLPVNTVELGRIAALAEDEVVRCEECRCILVRVK
jgi:predicted  nucleic acid-binding Zn-ribbon protein